MLQIFVLAALILKGQAALIQTQLTVMAAVGDEACLSCQLTQHKEVLQVTWQKISPEGEKDVAISTKYFNPKVYSAFRDKVEFKDAGLQNSSIVIRNVTEQDESCYQCSFKIYNEVDLTGRTWLKVYGEVKPSSADGVDELSGSNNRDRSTILITVSLLVVLVVCGILTLVFFPRKRENENGLPHRDNEMNEMVEATIKDTEELQTLSAEQEIRQLTPEKEQTTNGLKALPLTARRLDFDLS